MCDFYSWIEKGKKLYFLDDATIEARWPNDDIREHIGHSAIEKVFPDAKGGMHKESAIDIPSKIAQEINLGHMDKMAKAGGWSGARYTSSGHLCSPWWENVEQLIIAVKKFKYLDRHGEEKKEWKVFDTRAAAGAAARAAAGAAAGDAARDAARDAAGDAAWAAAGAAARAAAGDAAGAAARGAAWAAAGAAAWDAARSAAGSAAGDAAWDAAWDAARAAAGDAALYARCLIADPGLPHSKHVTERLEVWKSGYGLLCDVSGVLYVYRRLA